MLQPLYVGFTLKARRPVPPAPVPSNIKDPAKIREYQQRNSEAAALAAATVPTAGSVAAFHLLDHDGRDVARLAGDGPAPARQLLAAVVARFPGDGCLPAAAPADFALVGFGVHELMRVACLEVLVANRSARVPFRVPAALHRGEHALYDPYLLLLHTEARRHVDLPTLLREFGVLGDDAAPGMLADPLDQALCALELSRRAQLFAPLPAPPPEGR
jgi:hypothetical protein